MQDKQASLLTLEQYIPYRLSILSNKVSALVAQAYKNKFALSITEWRIMAVLGEYSDISADEISNKTQIEKSIISRAVNSLLKRSLIERYISKEDKRRSEIRLSSTGYDVYAEIVPASLAYEEELLRCLSEDEQAVFSNIMSKLDEHAQTLNFLKDS
uniref:MarR family winged helix-turn-helix transcriptional regulator n=1 Tax=Ningiella ruwaisensis TaxID=2364274 RepID=UPI0010A0BE93|nr:MarR family transcriptional regulator [Ningiella ruwaisensis]